LRSTLGEAGRGWKPSTVAGYWSIVGSELLAVGDVEKPSLTGSGDLQVFSRKEVWA
jgi:hypothetical protein